MGIAVPGIRKGLKSFTVTLGCVMMGAGYAGLALSGSMPLIILSSACVGASYSIFYSSVFLKISDLSRDDQENTALVTFTTAGMFFGRPYRYICFRRQKRYFIWKDTGSGFFSWEERSFWQRRFA